MTSDKVNDNYRCKDCKHCFITITDQIVYAFKDSPFRYSCKLYSTQPADVFDVVVGTTYHKRSYLKCYIVRTDEDKCGPSAKDWVPKHKKHLFLALQK